MMAASLVGIAPVLIIFIFLQRYIVVGDQLPVVLKTKMDKYKLHEKIFLYFGIFNFFNIYPSSFCRDVVGSLRPLDHLFRSPYQF